jgi:endonuclease/exonuclease/phosphatase family metal-dependent hydrolase
MAKHLGTRRQPRLRSRRLPVSRGVVWAGVGLAAVTTVTVVAISQGVAGSDDPIDLSAARSGATDTGATDTDGTTGSGHHGDASASAGHRAPSSVRRVDVSRQADRPATSTYRVQHGVSLKLKPAAILARKKAALSPATSTFTIAQSNILGSQHTRGAGGFGPGTYRAGITASLLTSRGVDVGGMQEVQADQLGVLRARMPAYSFWPASALGHNGLRLQIYWQTDEYTMIDNGSVSYTFASQRIPLPYVLLRDNASGAEFWMITTHNSAGGLEGQRDEATGIEISLINRLKATGLPVIITGDMNEHTEFFCRVAASTGMVAANGGSGVGGCHLPPPPLRVDWIMGGGGVSFSGYHQDAAGLGRASDHYYLYSQVTTTSSWFPAGTGPS